MSQEVLTQIVARASTDATFRTQLERTPQQALAGYDLTADERAALASGEPSRLEALGVDVRLTKWGGSETKEPTGGDDLLQPWQN